MSISLALQNGLSGLTASQAGLAAISQNVANANTVGYSRQVLSLQQRVINGVNSGVQVGNVDRVVDSFLVRELQAQISRVGETLAASQFYTETQSRFGTPGNNSSLSADLAQFGAALDTLSVNPEDPALGFNVVAAGVAVARSISEFVNGVQKLRNQADTEIKSTVDAINLQLRNVFDLNTAIARAKVNREASAGLEDRRDQAVSALAKNVSISSFIRKSGELTILAEGGLALVDNEVREFDYTPAAVVNDTTVFGAISIFRIEPTSGARLGDSQELVSFGASATIVSNVAGGRLKGLIDVRDGDLNDLAAQVETIATAVRDQYNEIHNDGVSFPALNSLAGTRTVTTVDSFTATGTVRIAVLNADGGIAAAPVDLDLTALGAVTVGTLATTIDTALGADGSAAVVNGKLVITATDAAKGIAINASDSLISGTAKGFPQFFGLNDFFTGVGGADFAVRQDIVGDPSRISTAELSLTASAGQAGITVGDNRVIARLSALTEIGIAFAAVAGLPAGTFTLQEYAGAILGLNAVQTAAAVEGAELQQSLFENLDHRNSSLSGVNVDEELANMLVFQISFAASARVLNAAREMFDLLIEIAR